MISRPTYVYYVIIRSLGFDLTVQTEHMAWPSETYMGEENTTKEGNLCGN